jgi:hypothetical protein
VTTKAELEKRLAEQAAHVEELKEKIEALEDAANGPILKELAAL